VKTPATGTERWLLELFRDYRFMSARNRVAERFGSKKTFDLITWMRSRAYLVNPCDDNDVCISAVGRSRLAEIESSNAIRRGPSRERRAAELRLLYGGSETFWDRAAQSDGCWIWKGSRPGRYGGFVYEGVTILAHRAAYILDRNELVGERHICHTCDNPQCVRPSHLFAGSHQDNMDDMRIKGRSAVQKGTTAYIGKTRFAKQANI
jgi:hypothetical protein